MEYLIDIPPATISGELHMGHMFSYSQMDYTARYQKLLGKELVYPFCYDNNGLPTEKLAQKKGHRTPNEILEFSNEKAEEYRAMFKAMGLCLDDNTYSTFDDNAIKLANMSFEDLMQKGLIYKADTEYYWCPVTNVSVSQSELTDDMCYERSGAKVEIRRGEGYFIKMMDYIPEIRAAIEEIEWHPVHFKHRLLRWLDELKFDWSISRERTYGIPIPGEPGIVFDTWFTSSLSPQMAYAAYGHELTLDVPIFDARFQAHDIIRTWALFTIVKSLHHNGRIPWKKIIISGHALDKSRLKLSKSSSNYKPLNVHIEKWGNSPIRYWAAQNQVGTDTLLDEDIMLQGKKLLNKIRNARKFINMQTDDEINLDWQERWEYVKVFFHYDMETIEYSLAIKNLTKFFWNKLCDEYIEENKKNPATGTLKAIIAEVLDYYEIFMPDVKDLTS